MDNKKTIEEKTQVEEKNDNCGNVEISKNFFLSEKICSSRCTICQSEILKQVHDWRNSNLNYKEICNRALEEYGVSFSPSSLSRHFKNYQAFKMEAAMQIIKQDTIAEITTQSVHIRKTVELLDLAYEKILAQMRSAHYKIDISDLEKLAKMRYQILNGENPDESSITAIFQKASNEYGLDVQQGILFKS